MNSVSIAHPRSHDEAAALLRDDSYSLPQLKGGGMDIIDHMKEGLSSPDLLIDVRGLGSRTPVRIDGDRIALDASVTLAQLAESSIVREHAPALAQAAESAATPQVRNVATAAGNLLQRPRCWYYRQSQFDCLKKGGARCYAVEGENKYHAIFGGGPCHIVHPSNIAPALMLGDAQLHLKGGDRDSIAISDLFHLPETGVKSEHNLRPEEVVTHITMNKIPRSGFSAIKEKQSFDWPMVFAVVSVDVIHAEIHNARVVAGAVAPVPWELPNVAKALEGVHALHENQIDDACAQAARGASPMSDNAYKLKLLPIAIRRAVQQAAADGARQW